jgi:hypothetical protein
MSHPDEIIDDERLAAELRVIVEEYLRRKAAGEVVSEESLLASHREAMPQLREELRNLQLFADVRGRESAPTAADNATVGRSGGDTGVGHLSVRCPSCHEPMQMAVDTPFTDLVCSICGSQFSIVDQSKTNLKAPTLSTLGRFELLGRIGVGSFGVVWKARDRELDRLVAIKIPRRGDMSPQEAETFLREARAAAQLRHPGIISVHEVGREGDSVFIVSDFVKGVTLSDWLSGQQPGSREAAAMCVEIATALQHAHDKGIVHRDLKPANIIIDGYGRPHLMDFGLARREVGEVTVTLDGQVLGTPAYMSPEQAVGEGHTADRRSDVYSLGVILFQLLTGELPFRGSTRMILHQVEHDEPPSPRKLNSNISKDLETIVLKCLEKRPSDRYQTASELADELTRVLEGRPISARPSGLFGRVLKWYLRNTMATILTAGGYGLIMTFVMMSWDLTGLLLLSLGKAEATSRIIGELVVLEVVAYPLMFFFGLATIKGRLLGIIAGVVFSLLWTLLTFAATFKIDLGFFQLEGLSAPQREPYFHFQLTILLLLLSLIGTLLYSLALYAKIRGMTHDRANRRSRPDAVKPG